MRKEECNFQYKFKRVDAQYKQNPLLSGFNFRVDEKYYENNELKRDLLKAFGLRFLIVNTGQGNYKKIELADYFQQISSLFCILLYKKKQLDLHGEISCLRS